MLGVVLIGLVALIGRARARNRQDGAMRHAAVITAVTWAIGGCGGQVAVPDVPRPRADVAPRLPRAPGDHAPSLVAIARAGRGEVGDGDMLSDVDSCATCHPDAAAQWATSAHSFASF